MDLSWVKNEKKHRMKMTTFYKIHRLHKLYMRKIYEIKIKVRVMRKNVGFEASFGLGLFYLCFLNILNRGMGRVEIL